MKLFLRLLLFAALLLPALLHAQTEAITKNDSANSAMLDEYNAKIADMKKAIRQDSIEKARLSEQLARLQPNNETGKQQLSQRIAELDQKTKDVLEAKRRKNDSVRKAAKSFTVTDPFGKPLFTIYARIGSFSAKERAQTISSRVNVLANEYAFTPDSLKIVAAENSSEIVNGENIVMVVSREDALWNDSTTAELAEEYRNAMIRAITDYRKQTSFAHVAREIGLALLVLLVIALVIWGLGKLFRFNARKISEQEGKRVRGITIKDYVLLDARRQIRVLLLVNTVVKWLLILIVMYITLPILFGIFPRTQDFAEVLFGYIMSPVRKIMLQIWHYLPNLFTIAVVVILFRYVLKAMRFLRDEIRNGKLVIHGFYADWANPTYQILRILVIAFMVVVIFPYLPGSDSPVFKGVSVFLGFLFTFGSAGSLSNVIAGLVLTYMRLFRIGDRVKIGDITGDIIEKSLLVTRVRTIKNEIISIPNSTVMGSHTINYSSDADSRGLIIHSTVTIGYDIPWKQMHEALIDAAGRTGSVLQEPAPFVLQTSLDDFYVSYEINAYIREASRQASIYSELHANIQDACNERGIEIMSPHYRAARDGSHSTIPQNYLPENYVAPFFRFGKENK